MIELTLQQHATEYALFPENWEAVCWFSDVSDLMRLAPNGKIQGLDLPQVQAEAQLMQRSTKPGAFQKLRQLANYVVKELNGE